MMDSDTPQAVQDFIRQASHELCFRLNGREIRIANPDPSVRLVDYLRDGGLTGTKVGCNQGGCGACTVMLSRRTGSGMAHRAVNACLRPVAACADTHITTIEGIGNLRDGLDPVQHRIALHNGTQCGYCTPGFVMAMHAFLRAHPAPGEQAIEDLFGGNLCRCTGYRPILHGMRTFACDRDGARDPGLCCEVDPFFPIPLRSTPVVVDAPAAAPRRLYFFADGTHWFRPTSLAEAQELQRSLTEHFGREAVKIVVGNTAAAIYPDERSSYLIDISQLPELTLLQAGNDGVVVGAAVAIQDLSEFAEAEIGRRPRDQTTGLRELVRHLTFLAGLQIRSAGSVGGNIVITKSHTRRGEPFPSDLFTVLAALGATATLSSGAGAARTVPLADLPATEDWPAGSVLVSIQIPFTQRGDYVQTHRVARRPQMAHPIVNAGFRFRLDDSGRVSEAVIVYGGLSRCNGRLPRTEGILRGKPWDETTLRTALESLKEEIRTFELPHDHEGFTPAYRWQLAESFFYKTFLHVAKQVCPERVNARNVSAADHQHRPLSRGEHQFQTLENEAAVTRPIAKRASFSQAAGQVRYPSDEPLPRHGCHAVLVLSPRPHARFRFVPSLEEAEWSLREKFPEFVALVTAADVPGANLIGLGGDDPVFCDGEASCVGAPICLVLAETMATAERVAEHVGNACIEYVDLPATVTLEEAIARQSKMPMMPGAHPDPSGR